jgi:hypothetical protein
LLTKLSHFNQSQNNTTNFISQKLTKNTPLPTWNTFPFLSQLQYSCKKLFKTYQNQWNNNNCERQHYVWTKSTTTRSNTRKAEYRGKPSKSITNHLNTSGFYSPCFSSLSFPITTISTLIPISILHITVRIKFSSLLSLLWYLLWGCFSELISLPMPI